MASAKSGIYYTFKVMTPELNVRDPNFLVQCHKWDEYGDEPMATYRLLPNNHSAVGGCSCPAWKANCKHRKCVDELIDRGYIQEAHRWCWAEKAGWTLDDTFNQGMSGLQAFMERGNGDGDGDTKD